MKLAKASLLGATDNLFFSAILPILTYGCDLFIPDTTTLKKLESFSHRVLWWTTNCFYTAACGALYREASLPPISSIIKHRHRSAAPPPPLGLRRFEIQSCHRPDTRVCAHLGPGTFCGRSSYSPPRLFPSHPPHFMALPGGKFREGPASRLLVSRSLEPHCGNPYPRARLNRSRIAPTLEGALHHLPSPQNSSDTVTPRRLAGHKSPSTPFVSIQSLPHSSRLHCVRFRLAVGTGSYPHMCWG